ncbi:MAG: DinB family protein [Acidobacteria bacterium]|nr:DinB family protein [Acidobacteriota bacterium]
MHERLFVYNDWAHREELAGLRALIAPNDTGRRLFAHILATEWLWLGRIGRPTRSLDVWPDLTLEQCAVEIEPLREAWQSALREVDLHAKVDYRNSKGESWTSKVEDILTHVVMHGAYHRGQIATVLRQSGEAPPYTDFIHATRAGLLPD